MSSDNLDLDINNYSIKDIEKFFRLKPNYKYTESDIELKEYELREQLLNSGHIDKAFKRDLIKFLNLAKEWLIFVKCNKNQDKNQDKKPSITQISVPQQPQPQLIPQPHPESRADNELVKRQDTPFVYANNSEFFQGKLNPLNTRTITKCLNIDTRFRDNFYGTQSSDFVIQLPTKFNKVVSMQLASFEIPISFYGISAAYGNNNLYLQVEYISITDNVTILTDEMTIVLPDGNYNAGDLLNTINMILSPKDECNVLINPNSIFNYIIFELDVNACGSGNGKVTVTPCGKYASNIQSIYMDFTRDINGNCKTNNNNGSILKHLGWNLGFIYPTYSGSKGYMSEAIMEVSSIRYIYLGIEDFNNQSNDHFISVMKDSFMSKDILARISLSGTSFSVLMENNMNIVTEPRMYFGPVDIQKIRIRLYDEYGNILQMNNSNYSFCLNLKLMYDL
jgi:hypothetical protein